MHGLETSEGPLRRICEEPQWANYGNIVGAAGPTWRRCLFCLHFDGAFVVETLFELKIEKTLKGQGWIESGLYLQLKAAITDGRLPAGTKLPPSRASGEFFGASRNTVIAAYERLLLEGLAVTRQGSGTYVADLARKIAIKWGCRNAPLRSVESLSGLIKRCLRRWASGEWQGTKLPGARPAIASIFAPPL